MTAEMVTLQSAASHVKLAHLPCKVQIVRYKSAERLNIKACMSPTVLSGSAFLFQK